MVRKIIVKKKMTDKEIAKREGEYFDSGHYEIILNDDADVYTEDNKLLIKFRKNVLDKDLGTLAAKELRKHARKTHENRGASAGELDRNKLANYIGDLVTPGKFRTRFKSSKTGILSKQATSNLSPSNIIGFFDKPDRNLKGKGAPCRLTAFNRDNPEVWERVLPFIEQCDGLFKLLVPDRHNIQYKKAQSVPNFAIADTSFSTITINYSWRTALHRDAGDLVEGFGNLIALKDPLNQNDYEGCYTGFPQYGVAVNVRHGDFAAMNVHEWHCNTEFKPISGKIKGKWSKKEQENLWYFNRLSMVCYLREKMIRCKNLDTSKIQLLNKNSDNSVFRTVRQFKRPDTYKEFKAQLEKLHKIFVKDIKKTPDKQSLNSNLSNYYSFLGYYYKDFSKYFTVADIKNINKELSMLKNTVSNYLNKKSKYILDYCTKLFTK